VHRGLIVSGDRFISTRADSDALRHALPDALAVEMEGAAVAQVCHDYGVPFALVRTISDRADDNAHIDFGRFIRAVASQYSRALLSELWQPDLQTRRQIQAVGKQTVQPVSQQRSSLICVIHRIGAQLQSARMHCCRDRRRHLLPIGVQTFGAQRHSLL
jgi:methylthioadenosine nucleosidase (EC 3.2.2.16)